MARYLFIAQQTLDTWMDQDKIDFDGDVMTIRADRRRFRLLEAVRFIKVEGADSDTNGLLGKVKTNEQLEQLGAERYMDSVIYKDIAYKVQEGFIGEVFLAAADKVVTLNVPKTTGRDSTAEPSAPRPVTARPAVSAAEKISKDIQAARTEPELKKVSSVPPSLPKSPSAPASIASPKKVPPSIKKTEGKDQAVETMSDEELLTRFLLDNL